MLRRFITALLVIVGAFGITAATTTPAHAVNMWVKNEDVYNDNRWIRCVYDGSGYIDIGPEQTRVLTAGGRKCWVPAYTRVAKKYVGDCCWTTYGDAWDRNGYWGPVFSWATNISFSVDDKANGLG